MLQITIQTVKYIGVQFKLNNYEIYEYIQVHFKDDNFIVSSIVGGEFLKILKLL